MSVLGKAALRSAAALLLTATVGCYRSIAPPGWLPIPAEAQRDAFGSWILILARPDTAPLAEGELIAVDTDTIHVLSAGRLVSVPRASICCAELAAFRMDVSELQIWSALGLVSTVSHGFGLIFSAPFWIVAGTAATASASHAPQIRSTDPAALRPFARFPQGIPAGLDRSTIRERPWEWPVRRERRR